MIELLIAYAFGRATKGMNPLQVCIGLVVAWAILAVLGLTAYAVWTYAPQAAEFIAGLGIVPDSLVDYMRIESVPDGDILKIISQLSKRMMVCALAMMFIGMGLMMFSWSLGLVLKPVAKLFQKADQQARS